MEPCMRDKFSHLVHKPEFGDKNGDCDKKHPGNSQWHLMVPPSQSHGKLAALHPPPLGSPRTATGSDSSLWAAMHRAWHTLQICWTEPSLLVMRWLNHVINVSADYCSKMQECGAQCSSAGPILDSPCSELKILLCCQFHCLQFLYQLGFESS